MISILTFESPHGSYTDASAVAAWLDRGDEAAAEWLFEKYFPLVRHICSRRLPRLWMVEDTAEDTMSRAFLSLQNFDVTRCFSSWIGSIAVHACADKLRCHSRQSEIAVNDMDSSVGYYSDTNRDERIAIVRELLEALPQGVRSVLELHYFEGLTAREVADKTGLTPANVAVRLMRARRVLYERCTRTAC